MKKNILKKAAVLALVGIAVLCTGCGKGQIQGSTDKIVQDVDHIEVSCYVDKLLVGDNIMPRIECGTWILEGASKGIKWSSTDASVVDFDNGVLQAKGAGTCTITAEYNGMFDSMDVSVYEVDSDSGIQLVPDTEELELESGGGAKTVKIGYQAENSMQTTSLAYYSSELSLVLAWSGDTASTMGLDAKDLYSGADDGYITVLTFDQNDLEHLVAATKIHVKIQK